MERWLPEELGRLGGAGLPPMTVRFRLSGEGGGCWDVTTGAEVRGRTCQPEARPLVTIAMTAQDWRAIAVGEQGPVDLCPPAASPTDLLFVDTGSQQLLQSLSGTFRFEVEQYNGRTWQLTATFGEAPPAERPDAVISTDAATYAAILGRRLSAPEAYFGGQIRIEGDAGLGMQVGLALLPKF